MEELRAEVGVKKILEKKLAKSRLKWAGRKRLMKSADEKKKTETEMGRLRDERFGGSVRGGESESE